MVKDAELALCRTWSRAGHNLATARLMASHPLVSSDPKALSAIGRSLPWLIQRSFKSSSPVISVNFQQNKKTANASLSHTQSVLIRARKKGLHGFPSSKPLLIGIKAGDQCSLRI